VIGQLRRRVHELARHLLHDHTAPSKLAFAVFVGCVVGCTPLFGFHIFVCIALAWLLRLNQVVLYGAANISIPPMIPFIGFASVQLGERLLHRRWLALHLADFTWRNAPALGRTFFLDWLVGGLAVGGAAGLVGGAIVYRVITLRRAHKQAADPVLQAIDRARLRYRGLHRSLRFYAHFKYQLDPCYRAIAPLVPPGSFTVDLGTGLAMLPVLLGELGDGRRALGVEWDAVKVKGGLHAAQGLPGIIVVEGDVRAFPLPQCDVITLVDMLHYYDAAVQRALLERCRAALRPDGKLLIREGDRERAGAARWTRFVEKTVTRLGWNRGPEVAFRPIAELKADLVALGFAVTEDEVAGKLHPGNVLLVATPAAGSSSS
jgi:uncharacterized protein (DUF2062 family)/SAM-dependent methyltransferase